MERISSGLTWKQVLSKFDADKTYSLSLRQFPRRLKKGARKKWKTQDQQVWRLILQQDKGFAVKTLLRKNLRDAKDGLLSDKVDETLIELINSRLG